MARALQPKVLLLTLLLALPLCLLLAISSGPVPIPFLDAVTAFFNGDAQNNLIVQHIRAPRAILALSVGAILAVCGAAMQGLFRNPLADPSLIGVSGGALAGASFAIVLGEGLVLSHAIGGLSLVAIGAFVGGAFCALFVYRLATGVNGTSVATMLLAGIAITALAGAANHLLEYIADNNMLRRISLWQMGGLDGASWPRVLLAVGTLVILLARLPAHSAALNALLLGESEARHLGINVQKLKIELIVLAAFGVGVVVALAGTIAFVGLVIPHIVRLLIGPDHRYLLPCSACGGAVLLLLADVFARLVISPAELPIGIVTAVLGAPFFISLLRQRHKYGME